MKGFSISNIKYMKQGYLFYNKPDEKSQQPVGQITENIFSQITRIPWGHNIAIISKCKTITESLYYIQQTIENSWSRSVLVNSLKRRRKFLQRSENICTYGDLTPMVKSNPDIGENASLIAGGTVSIPQIERIVAFQWTTEQIGSTDYAYDSQIDNFKSGSYKCNKFVSDAYEKGAGVDFPKHRALGIITTDSPARAATLADPDAKKIGEFKITNSPQIGDVVASPPMQNGEYGHVGIYGLNGNVVSASSRTGTVVNISLERSFFTSPIIFRFYQKGEEK